MKKLPDHHILKSELRTELRQRRSLLDDIHRNILDTAINTHLVNYARQESVKTVAAYLAFEPSCLHGPARLVGADKTCWARCSRLISKPIPGAAPADYRSPTSAAYA